MKKRKIFIASTVFFVLLLFIVLFFNGREITLENAIKSSRGGEVDILKINNEEKIVVFRETSPTNKNTYIINTFNNRSNGTYKYSTDTEFGFTVNSPFMLNIQNFKGVGNIVWGVINNEEVTNVKITFAGNSNGQKFEVLSDIQNEAYSAAVPVEYKKVNLSDGSWTIMTEMFNKKGELLSTHKGL